MTSIISYGRTLRTAMTPGERLRHIAAIPARKVVGCVGISVVRSNAPGISDVEVALDGIDPQAAIQAMLVAIKRLTIVHSIEPSAIKTAVIEPGTLESVRQDAEALTDYCRDGTLGANGKMQAFDHQREDCVQMLMSALAVTIPSSVQIDETALLSVIEPGKIAANG